MTILSEKFQEVDKIVKLRGLVLDRAIRTLKAELPEGTDLETRTQLEIDKRMIMSKILPACVGD